jgi:hypothetical protein
MRILVVSFLCAASQPVFACADALVAEQLVVENLADQDRTSIRIANSYLSAGRPDKAIPEAQRVLDGRSGHSARHRRAAQRILGLAALGLHKFHAAAANLAKALGSSHEPYLEAKLGEAEVGAGKLALALVRLEELERRELIPDDSVRAALMRARTEVTR